MQNAHTFMLGNSHPTYDRVSNGARLSGILTAVTVIFHGWIWPTSAFTVLSVSLVLVKLNASLPMLSNSKRRRVLLYFQSTSMPLVLKHVELSCKQFVWSCHNFPSCLHSAASFLWVWFAPAHAIALASVQSEPDKIDRGTRIWLGFWDDLAWGFELWW